MRYGARDKSCHVAEVVAILVNRRLHAPAHGSWGMSCIAGVRGGGGTWASNTEASLIIGSARVTDGTSTWLTAGGAAYDSSAAWACCCGAARSIELRDAARPEKCWIGGAESASSLSVS
jgi:hypothetical protein